MSKRERGWFGESLRHSMASRGIKVGGKYRGKSVADIIEKDLIKAKRSLSINRISQRTGLSWPTVKNHTKALEKKGKIICEKDGNKMYCRVKSRGRK